MSQYRAPSLVDMIVIHCSATPNGQFVTALDIDKWHKARGFKRDAKLAVASNLKHIGYHFIVYANGGALLSGRRIDETGAHAAGYNGRSIGICMIGTDKYCVDQWLWLRKNIEYLQHTFTGIQRIVGHRDLSVDLNGDGVIQKSEWMKTCPGFDVKAWLDGGMQPLSGHIFEDENG